MDSPDQDESHGLGVGFLRKPAVLAAGIVLAVLFTVRAARPPLRVESESGGAGTVERGPADLPAAYAENKLGLFGAKSKFASVVGKQGESLSTRARVMNVFRMKKALVAVTEASVFIHATFADGLPEWVRPGKSVQLEGQISEVKTKTNIYLAGTQLRALN